MNVDDAFDLIRTAYTSGRLSQAYLLVGHPRGPAGELAERMLMLLFCETPGMACGTCRGCRLVRQHTHPDIQWVEPQLKSRVISMKHIRALEKQLHQTAFEGGWKAGVLVAADRLGNAASNFAPANAFLKTLEEPPERCLLLLLTESPQFLLPTIVSRCQRLTVGGGAGMPAAEWSEPLMRILTAPMVPGPTGAFARAEAVGKLLGTLLKETEAKVDTEADAEAVDEEDETLDARISSLFREQREAVMREMLHWHRDILLLVCGGDPAVVYHSEYLEQARAAAARLTYRRAMHNLSVVEHMNTLLERNVSQNHVLSFGFSRIV